MNIRPASVVAVLVAIASSHEEAALAQHGGALEFDGTDDRVTVPYDDSFPTEDFSICAWIKVAPSGHRSAIIARGEDDDSWDLAWQLYLEPNGSLRLMVEDSAMQNFCYPYVCFSQNLQDNCNLTGNLLVADDTWHHVAATRSASGDLVMYVDGQAVADCVQTGVPSSDNFQDLTIGCTHGYIGPPPGGEEPPIWFFPGRIDEPAMWNLAMTPSQIDDVYVVGVDPRSSGLVGYWAFDEASGQVVGDSSPLSNNGYLGADPDTDDADPLWIVDDGAAVGPLVFNAFRGFHVSGDLGDVLASDDSDLCHEPGIVLNPTEAPVTLDFIGTLPNDSPSTLDVTIESSANTVGLELTISFWNFNTASWDIVGTDPQSLNADTVRTFAGNPANHIEPSTGEVRTRYEVRQVSFIFLFPWTDCVDQVFWAITN